MKLKLKLNGKMYDVEILQKNDKTVRVRVGDKKFTFKEKEEDVRIAKASFPKRNFSKKEITAPITGEISEIFIKKGDFIEKEKKIILLSAMKMENEIISDFKGKVKKVLITKNQKVNKGDILVMLE
jgi:biotin carboxyl carrier protein